MAAQRSAPQGAAAQGRELLADVGARRLAGGAPADQRFAGLEHERLHLVPAHAEDLGDVVLGVIAELEEHERRALLVGQAAEVADERPQVRALLDLGGEAAGGDGARPPRAVLVEGELVAPRPQHRQAAVARDRVEPGLDVLGRAVALEGAVGRQEGVLERVLGLLAGAEQVPAEGEQRPGVAVVELLEGALVAAPDAGGEGGVGALQARQAPALGGHGPLEGGSLHAESIGHSVRNLDTKASDARWAPQVGRWLRAACPLTIVAALMASFRHDGRRLAYTVYGEGERTTVLIHGLLLSQKMHVPLAQGARARAATASSRSTCSATAGRIARAT